MDVRFPEIPAAHDRAPDNAPRKADAETGFGVLLTAALEEHDEPRQPSSTESMTDNSAPVAVEHPAPVASPVNPPAPRDDASSVQTIEAIAPIMPLVEPPPPRVAAIGGALPTAEIDVALPTHMPQPSPPPQTPQDVSAPDDAPTIAAPRPLAPIAPETVPPTTLPPVSVAAPPPESTPLATVVPPQLAAPDPVGALPPATFVPVAPRPPSANTARPARPTHPTPTDLLAPAASVNETRVQTPQAIAPQIAPPPQPSEVTAEETEVAVFFQAFVASTPKNSGPAVVVPMPTDVIIDEAGLDAPSDGAADAPKPAKPEAAVRPFGNLAPATGLMAQMNGESTPVANAPAIAASTAPAETTTDATATAAVKEAASTPTSAEPSAHRAETVPSADLAATTRAQAAVEAGGARSARPAYHPIVAQVAMHVAQAAIDGNDKISIRLSPADLGRIDVRLDFGPDGRIQAVFAADRPQTVDLLQRDARDLERALQDAGLRADSGSLSFNLRGEQKDRAPSFAPSGLAAEAAAEAAAPHVQAYAAGSASLGRLDIHV